MLTYFVEQLIKFLDQSEGQFELDLFKISHLVPLHGQRSLCSCTECLCNVSQRHVQGLNHYIFIVQCFRNTTEPRHQLGQTKLITQLNLLTFRTA
jgi:hypothetical protein